jgi:hypothetical protein
MFEIHSQTIARLQRQVTELEEERVRLQGYQCDIVGEEVAKRVKELENQLDAAFKHRDYWEKECIVARKERDKATQGVKYDGDTLSCETIIKHMTNGSLEINSRFIGGGGGGGE